MTVNWLNRMTNQIVSRSRDALTGMRLLGNVGSHTLDRVTAADIEQAYTIIEFVLRKIYEGSMESVRQLTDLLSERFQPVPRSA